MEIISERKLIVLKSSNVFFQLFFLSLSRKRVIHKASFQIFPLDIYSGQCFKRKLTARSIVCFQQWLKQPQKCPDAQNPTHATSFCNYLQRCHCCHRSFFVALCLPRYVTGCDWLFTRSSFSSSRQNVSEVS